MLSYSLIYVHKKSFAIFLKGNPAPVDRGRAERTNKLDPRREAHAQNTKAGLTAQSYGLYLFLILP